MKKAVKLIYFKSCPKAADAKRAIEMAGVKECEVIIQDDLQGDDPNLRYSSPSILIGDRIILGSFQDGAGACSTEKIAVERIIKLLRGDES